MISSGTSVGRRFDASRLGARVIDNTLTMEAFDISRENSLDTASREHSVMIQRKPIAKRQWRRLGSSQ